MNNAYENRMKNCRKQHTEKMQHYFGNLTRINNSDCKPENAQPQENHIQKENTNMCTKHLRKSASPGFQARSQPGQLALDNNSCAWQELRVRNGQAIKIFEIFLKKKLTNQIRAVSRPSYVYVWKHCLEILEFKNQFLVKYWG